MSREPAEARILVRPSSDGKKELSVLDPKTGREVRTGLQAQGDSIDKEIRSLKNTLERAGNRVTVKEM